LPKDADWQQRSAGVFKTAMETSLDAVELYRPVSDKSFQVLPEAVEIYAWETTPKVIETWKKLVSEQPGPYLTEETFIKLQDQVKELAAVKGKQLFMPIRVAVIGKPHGAELKTLVP